MTDKITLELTLDELKELDKNLYYCEETWSIFDKIKVAFPQPQMNLQQEGDYVSVSYNDTTYYRLMGETTYTWYIKVTQPVPNLVMVDDAETERLLDGLYYNHIVVKKETAQESEENEWKLVALKLGENLSDNGPDGYYGFSADEWFEWVIDECLTNEVKRLQRKEWNAVRESVKWCEENPDKDPLDWLKPQTPEETEQGLKEAFREAVKQGIIPEIKQPTDELIEKLVKKPPEFLKFELGKTLEDVVHKWWQCIFSTNSDWDCETCIDDLIDQVELFLPREQDASGSQNTYAVAAVEGFNDAIKKIKSKLRNKREVKMLEKVD